MSSLQRRPMTVLEQRLTNSQPVDATLVRCDTCGGTYLDYPAGRDAHIVVFGHTPATDGTDPSGEPR